MKATVKNLLAFGPCEEGEAWLNKQKSIRAAWQKCKRADWMLWALSKLGMLDDKTARAFACDCAEHVLHFYEEKYPNDNRPRAAIEASRRTITDQSEEAAAAVDASRDASRDAAGAAARDAAGAASGAAARDAAWAAAGAAARDAAWAAAGDAAWAAENEWQANRLRQIVNPFNGAKKQIVRAA